MTTDCLHLRRSLGQWTSDSNLEWRYTQSPTNVLFDTTLRLQAICVRSSCRYTTFSALQHAPHITTFSTLATVSSLHPLTAASHGMTVQVLPPIPTPISFAAHLLLQPPGPRWLLQKFDQEHVSSDTCIMIEHLRFIKSKTISTDGGLSLVSQGTFGWMLSGAQGKKLVTGSGPVDGPATQASSTHSELHGFAAALEYIHQLAHYYSMPLKGEYKWECDSQCALNRIDVLIRFHLRRQTSEAELNVYF